MKFWRIKILRIDGVENHFNVVGIFLGKSERFYIVFVYKMRGGFQSLPPGMIGVIAIMQQFV